MKPTPRTRRPVNLDALHAATTVPKATPADPSTPAHTNASNTSVADNTANAADAGNASIAGVASVSGNTSTARPASQDLCRLTIRVPTSLAGRARTAWRTENANPTTTYPSFSAWVTQALLEAVERSEHTHNNARPYPSTPAGVIPTGRPVN